MTRAQRKILELLDRGWEGLWGYPELEPPMGHPDYLGHPMANNLHVTTRKVLDVLAADGFIERDEEGNTRLTERGREVIES